MRQVPMCGNAAGSGRMAGNVTTRSRTTTADRIVSLPAIVA